MFGAPLQMLGRIRPAVVLTCAVQVGCASALEIPLASGGSPPQALTLFEGVGLIAWLLRRPSLGECRRGPRYFSNYQTRVAVPYSPGWLSGKQIQFS